MARRSVVCTAPASSTGSPMTLMMRPSVASPTGTEIGPPVSVTSCPRTRPSVASIATVRTVDSPRCCATSRISRLPRFSVASAFMISGKWPSNCTSTTAPNTCVMWPFLLSGVIMFIVLLLKRLCARDNFDQFLGDHRLTRPVVLQRQLADHVACVARRRIHGAHLRAEFAGDIFQQRAKNLNADIARQERRENFAFVRLVFVLLLNAPSNRFDGCRDQLLRGRHLAHN